MDRCLAIRPCNPGRVRNVHRRGRRATGSGPSIRCSPRTAAGRAEAVLPSLFAFAFQAGPRRMPAGPSRCMTGLAYTNWQTRSAIT